MPRRIRFSKAAAVAIGARVGRRAPELVHEVPVGGGDLQPVEAALLAAARGGGEVGDDPGDVLGFHLLRDGSARRLPPWRGGDGGQPVVRVPARAPAHVGELDHQPGAVAVDALGELLKVGNDGIVGDGDLIPGRRRAVECHGGGAAEHGEPDAALRFLLVVELITLLRLAVLAVARRMACAHHPVADGETLETKRLEQRVGVGDHGGTLVARSARASLGRRSARASLSTRSARGARPKRPR